MGIMENCAGAGSLRCTCMMTAEAFARNSLVSLAMCLGTKVDVDAVVLGIISDVAR